ncbi:MAG: YerC/YecD family TrpR-related protein [Patescibacteria group bacterium]
MFEQELKNKEMKELFKAITSLKTEDDCKKFFRDLCTFAELKSMSERWQVAKQVEQKISYRKIAKNTGSSTATITRVAHWVHHGMGGYKLILDRMK